MLIMNKHPWILTNLRWKTRQNLSEMSEVSQGLELFSSVLAIYGFDI